MTILLANSISNQNRDLFLHGAKKGVIAALSACLLSIVALGLVIMVWGLL